MKPSPFTYGVDEFVKNADAAETGTPSTPEPGSAPPRYWRSLDEFADSPEFREATEREFPEGASELKLDECSRRTFLTLMGASIGLAGLTGCHRPEIHIMPYSRAPEDVIPGVPQYYATAMPWNGTALGLVVESHGGRPTKIEGNKLHPESLGAAHAWGQASVLGLYDPDRSDSPRQGKVDKLWPTAVEALRAQATAAAASGGKGLAVLTENHRSPTVTRMLAKLTATMPGARVYRFDATARTNSREGTRIAFGRPLEPILNPGAAKVVVTLDSDFLYTEGSALKNARGFARARRLEDTGNTLNRLYSAESAFSVTGGVADHRLRTASRNILDVTVGIARELLARGVQLGGEIQAAVGSRKAQLDARAQEWVKAVASDLSMNRSASLVVAGERQPPVVHALAALINTALGNNGGTVRYVEPVEDAPAGRAAVKPLVDAMKAGQIDTLLILGGNPVLQLSALDFAAALLSVKNSFHLSQHVDETSVVASWHLPRAHFLEQWSDAVAEDGTAAVVQPLIAPLLNGKTDAEVLDLFLGGKGNAHELVKATWEARLADPLGFEGRWRQALHDGVFPNTQVPFVTPSLAVAPVAAALQAAPAADANGYELTFAPDVHAWDGSTANNGWLQEMPDPLTQITWDNVALASPTTAKKIGARDGEIIEITLGDKKLRVPLVFAPGQADDSLALTFGQGRTHAGKVGSNVGVDAYPLRPATDVDFVGGAQVRPTGASFKLARPQESNLIGQTADFALDTSRPIDKRLGASSSHDDVLGLGRGIIREAALTRYLKEPNFARKEYAYREKHNLSVFYEHKYEGHKWGMVIDLNSCIGCNACTVACYAENNIPIVGKDGVSRGRVMHWIRIDRYFEGQDIDDPKAVMQPIPCQQCEEAPCETVCPVAATSHSPEGLNDMAYNRCVGTRYCANNCPYKVRRFNFFNYHKHVPELVKMQMNPNVTVRSRGVMEKCTYCVQRINAAKILSQQPAHKDMVRARKRYLQPRGNQMVEVDAVLLKDGFITPACEQTCPTQAITFGDLSDPASKVKRLADSPRDYQVLAELNTRPRTTYLARVRNPNPALEADNSTPTPASSEG